jgi:hypothetical protein
VKKNVDSDYEMSFDKELAQTFNDAPLENK